MAGVKKRLAGVVADCRKVKATIHRLKWPLVRAIVELAVFRDDSPYLPTRRRVPIADLVVELERTPESIDDYLNDLAGLGYLDIDEDGVCLDGHANCFIKLARALAKEVARSSADENRAASLFDELLV